MTHPVPTYGGDGLVGIIDLSTCTSLIPEVQEALPDGVSAMFSRLRLPDGVVTVPTLQAMVTSDRFEEAGLELADAGVQAIAFACTSASLLLGPGFDRELSDRLHRATGLPATTTATALLRALEHLGARRICVGTPYDADVTERERAFLEAAGYEVLSIHGLGLVHDRDIGALSFDAVKALARRVHRPPADAVFLSCTNLPALPVLAALEDELGCPVFSSNAATIWETLRLIGAAPAGRGLGRLLSCPST
jgi:maleate isomerase